MKLSLLTVALLFGVVSCLSAVEGRERLRFDDGWKFHLHDGSTGADPDPLTSGEEVAAWRWKIDTNPDADKADVARPEFDDGSWETVQNGHGIIKNQNTFAWFRTVLPTAKGPKPRLHFEGVDDVAKVYLNGRLIAQHSGWEEAFDAALEAAWVPGGRNVLAVLVENAGGTGGVDAVYLQDGEAGSVAPVENGPAAARYDDHAWRDVQLPHDFVVEGTFDPAADASHGFLPTGAGWYRKNVFASSGRQRKSALAGVRRGLSQQHRVAEWTSIG